MRKRILAILALSGAAVIAVGVALGTPGQGVTPGPFHARGSAPSLRINDESMRLSLKAKSPLDVQVVSATIAPNGFTGWHTHNGPSIAIVKSGQLTTYEPGRGRRGDDDDDDDNGGRGPACEVSFYNAGTAFVHPKGPHNYKNTARAADGTAVATEFYIFYFLPPGTSPAPDNTTPVPAGCPA
jgi:hypothetical protein